MFINILLFLFFIILGAFFGKIFTFIAYKWRTDEEISFYELLYCPECGAELEIKSLIPIVSFILQKGKCLKCNKKLNIRYFIAELANCLIYGLMFLKFGFSFSSIYYSLLFTLILAMAMIDFEYYDISFKSQLSFIIFAIIYTIFNPIDPLFVLLSLIVYYAVIQTTKIVIQDIKNKEVLGDGDVRLMAVCGAFLGLKNLGVFLLMNGVVGILFYLLWKKFKKEEIFPFLPVILFNMYFLIVVK